MGLWSERVTDLFFEIVRVSAQSSLLVLLILILRSILRDRLSPRWSYVLWLILVLRLALPWGPQSRFSVYNLMPSVATPAVRVQARSEPQPVSPAVPLRVERSRPTVSPVLEDSTSKAVAPEPVRSLPVPQRSVGEVVLQVLPCVWLVGAMILAGYILLQGFALGVIPRQRQLTDQKTLDLLEDCKEQMGVHPYLAVFETTRVKSPSLFGFVRPRLLLPAGTVASLGPDRLRHIFLHELAHLKRNDILTNWITTLLQVIHWFNPLVWIAFSRMRIDRELACDTLALSYTPPAQTQEYGRTIVHLLENFSRPRPLPSLAGILEDKTSIYRRIAMIANFKKSSQKLSAAALLVVLGLSIVGLTNAEKSAGAASSALPPVSDMSLKVASCSKGGLFYAALDTQNPTDRTFPAFEVRFYLGDPKCGGKLVHNGVNLAGPIKPKDAFCEQSLPFALPEGENQIVAVIGPAKLPAESSEGLARLSLTVVVDKGKIIKRMASGSPSSKAAVPPPVSTGPDGLTESQRLYLQWTRTEFADNLDCSEYADTSPSLRTELEQKWIQALKAEQTPKAYRAISCLGEIRSKKALPALLRIATERCRKGNQSRWMATRSLGMIGDKSVVPELIPLLYHYNQNTRFWAQISLATLTGTNYGDDWQSWGQWWNAQGGRPAFRFAKVTWSTDPEDADLAKQKERDDQTNRRLQGTFKSDLGPADSPGNGDKGQEGIERKAQRLFDAKQYNEAIPLFRQVYEKRTSPMEAENALMMIGICYDHLMQPAKAIEYYRKAIQEFPKTDLAATWFYLGDAYVQTHEKDKALDAFRNCLRSGKGIRNPNAFPMKNAQEMLSRLEAPSAKK